MFPFFLYREYQTGEIWDVEVHCLPTERQPEEKQVVGTLDRADLSYANLLTVKAAFCYGTRDYFYYKNRCGNDRETYEELDIMKDLDDVIENMESEKKIRLLLTSEEQPKWSVPITPLKQSRVNESDDDEDGMDEEEEEEEEGMILNLMHTKIGSWSKALKQVIHIYCLWFTKE